jgi:hypothetical protein
LRFGAFAGLVGRERDDFCALPQKGWAGEFCQLPKRQLPSGWPEILAVGLPADYEMRRVFLRNGPPREELERGLATAAGRGEPIIPQRTGIFERYKLPNNAEYWVSTDADWRLPDGTPYTMNCSAAWCQVAFRLSDRTYAGYSFSAEADVREAQARRVHVKFMDLLGELLTPR